VKAFGKKKKQMFETTLKETFNQLSVGNIHIIAKAIVFLFSFNKRVEIIE
jgi:hypothetical protein